MQFVLEPQPCLALRADLRCHCLNFSGRVKEASVKNFQLVGILELCWIDSLLSQNMAVGPRTGLFL